MRLGKEEYIIMKKKALAILSALVVMAMGTMTVFGADSPSVPETEKAVSTQTATTSVAATDTPANYVSTVTVSAGFDVEAVSDTTVKATSVAVQNEILNDLAKTGETIKNDAVKKAATNNSKVTATILTVVDVKADSATKNAAGNYDVTLGVSTVKEGDAIAVLHWNGTKWETINPSKVANGSVTFEVSDLSPISIVRLAVESTTAKSPKTGETAPVAAAIVVVALLGAAVTGKKYFA